MYHVTVQLQSKKDKFSHPIEVKKRGYPAFKNANEVTVPILASEKMEKLGVMKNEVKWMSTASMSVDRRPGRKLQSGGPQPRKEHYTIGHEKCGGRQTDCTFLLVDVDQTALFSVECRQPFLSRQGNLYTGGMTVNFRLSC